MDNGTFNVDSDLRERLVAATKEGGGTATWSILKALDKASANPGNQLKQSNTKHDTSQEDFSSTGEHVES
ncbi:hypothetical protein FJTKL_02627 [Diaporthe vaccinii]|uniref:Uncharacterized protein n=1 Tax=Diaporthe vaccinii TaxID=105482 RepID=A0ABR4DXR2_9PEZI